MPSTDAFKPEDLVRHADDVPVPPVQEALPPQELGVRPARALPYTLDAIGVVEPADGSFRIQFRNTGRAAAVFHVRSGNSADVPRTYTVQRLPMSKRCSRRQCCTRARRAAPLNHGCEPTG